MKMTATLYGWDRQTWRRAIEWAADRDLKPWDIYDEAKWGDFARLRERWLSHGGPASGPSGGVIL